MAMDDNGMSNFRELMGFNAKSDQVMYEDDEYDEAVPNVQVILNKKH
jgi:hypothetical protein